MAFFLICIKSNSLRHARVIVPAKASHITLRGKRRQPTFFGISTGSNNASLNF